MSTTTKLKVVLSEKIDGGNDQEPTDQGQNQEGKDSSTIIDVPNTGSGYNRYDVLKTGMAVFSCGFIIISILFIITKKIGNKHHAKNSNQAKYKNKITKILNAFSFIFFFIALGYIFTFIKETGFAGKGFQEFPLYSNQELTFNAKILNSDDIVYVKDTITLMRDSDYGLKIYLHGSDTKLVNSEDPSFFINTLLEPGVLSNNTFGYTLDAPEGDLHNVIFNPIKLEDNKSELLNLEGPVHAGDTFDVYYAVRSNNLKPGTYELDLTYTAISLMPNEMQKMTTEVCSSMEQGIQYEFKDIRDGKLYHISKLADGQCWMTDDLAFELSTETTLTSETTDLNSRETFTPNRSTEDYRYGIMDYCSDTESCNENISVRYPGGESEENTIYYRWYTATLNSAPYTNEDIDEASASDSICPSGWSLPSEKDFDRLISSYGAENNPGALISGPANMKLGGYLSPNNPSYQSERGYYHSSTYGIEKDSLESFYLEIDTSKENEAYTSSNYGYNGYPVRCVAKLTSATIMFDKNTDSDVSNLPANIKITREENPDLTYTIPETAPEKAGLKFIGYSKTPTGSPQFWPGDNITLTSPTTTLYVIWMIDTGLTLQQMTQAYCENNIEEGKLYSFTDVRDGQEYTVSKYKDGNCWLAQNLDLDLDPEVTLTDETTDLPSGHTYTPNIATSNQDGLEWPLDECDPSDLSTCTQYSFDIGNHHDGNLYNIFSATAGEPNIDMNTFEFKPSTSSICPKGWKMANDQNYINLFSAYGINLNSEFDPNSQNIPHFTDSLAGFYQWATRRESDSIPAGYHRDMYDGELQLSFYQSAPLGIFTILEGEKYGYFTNEGLDEFMQPYGGSIRCYNAFERVAISYDKNADAEVENLPEPSIVELENGSLEITLSTKTPTLANHSFAGWATSASGPVEYQPGDTFIAGSSSVVLYAVWFGTIPDIETMQEMTSTVCDNLVSGVQYGLKDARDDKFYSIAKLDDGKCWMTSDLALELDKDTSLTNEKTDLNTKNSWTPYSSTETSPSDWYCSGENCDSTSPSLNDKGNYYYSWYAATANSVPTIENNRGSFAPDSICPKNWYLPSKNDYSALINAYISTNLMSPPSNFKANGYKYYSDSSISSFGYQFRYWTGTTAPYRYNHDTAYRIYAYADESSAYVDSTDNKAYGLSVRCLLNTPSVMTISFTDSQYEAENMPSSIETTGSRGSAKITMPQEIPTQKSNPSYLFAGWSTIPYYDSNIVQYQPGQEVEVSGNTTFYANWEYANSLHYNANGNNVANMPNNQYALRNSQNNTVEFVIPNQIPERGDYEFLGWSTNYSSSSAEYQPGDSYVTESYSDYNSYTLYAIWQRTADPTTLMFNDNANGSTVNNMPGSITAVRDSSSNTVTFNLPNNVPTRSGSNFLGWSDNQNATVASYQPGQSYTRYNIYTDGETLTLYAIWQSPTTLIFDMNAGTDTVTNIPGQMTAFRNIYSNSVTFTLPETSPERSRFTFLGWSESLDSINIIGGSSYTKVGNYDGQTITLYAIWDGPATLAFDKNAGEDEVQDLPNTMIADLDQTTEEYIFEIPSTPPSRTGYQFLGYSENPNETTNFIQPGVTLSLPESYSGQTYTLYAIWQAPTTLNFNADAGNDVVENMPQTMQSYDRDSYGIVTFTLPDNIPTRSDYEFKGWVDVNTGNNIIYQPGEIFIANTSTGVFDWTLTATWQAKTAKAIVDATGNLDFVFNTETYAEGDTYRNSKGADTTITQVCNPNIMDTTDPYCHGSTNNYASRKAVKTAHFTDSFKDYRPTSAGKWFYEDNELTEITGLENLNTSKTISMRHMFYRAKSLTSITLPENFGSEVKYINEIFYDAFSLAHINYRDKNGIVHTDAFPDNFGSQAMNMISMFENASSLASLTFPENFGSQATYMSSMFSGASALEHINYRDKNGIIHTDALPENSGSQATSMSSMFNRTAITSLTFPENFGSQATSMRTMFQSSAITSLTFPENFGSQATDMGFMFNLTSALTSLTFPENFGSQATDMRAMFQSSAITSLTFPENFGSQATDMGFMFNLTSALTSLTFPENFGSKATDMSKMFKETTSLTSLTFPENFGSKATDTSYMFEDASAIASLTFPKNFGSQATDMSYMFFGASSLASLTFPENFGSQAMNMISMFKDASSLASLTFPENFGSQTTYMSSMFEGTSSLASLTFPENFGSQATGIGHMFYEASALTSLTFPENFGSQATGTNGMFYEASALTSLTFPENFGSRATNMSYMFYKASALTSLTFPENFGSKATDTSYMFSGASALERIYVPTGTDWESKEVAVTSSKNMFSGTSKLPNYTSSRTNVSAAHIGDKNGVKGYFTDIADKPANEALNPLGVVANGKEKKNGLLAIIIFITITFGTTIHFIIVIKNRRKEDEKSSK